VEAAEQCGGTFVPEVAELLSLDRLLSDWPPERRLMFCDEALADTGPAQPLPDPRPTPEPWAILIGPEGGFSEPERARLHAMPQASAVQLGPRILRADTAAVAAMTLWQMRFGDWT
jgi:16S rRNA (uracil1498-N3)-methyltransferase